MMRPKAIIVAALLCAVLIWIMAGRAARAQAGSAPVPRFEVASIKPANPAARPGRMGGAINTRPGMLTSRAASLKDLIEAAWGIEGYQVTGGPGWLDSERFAVDAKAPSPANREQLMLMLRALLADRFKLAFHRQSREMAVYALVVAKNGPKFHRLETGITGYPAELNRLGRNVDMAWFARYLTRFGSDRPVIDRTGLPGNWDLNLDMEKIAAAAAENAGGTPGIQHMFEATANILESQLGLKLTPTKATVEMFAIDRVERPSPN